MRRPPPAVPAPNLPSVMHPSPAAMLCSVLSQIACVFPPCEFMKREKGGGVHSFGPLMAGKALVPACDWHF